MGEGGGHAPQRLRTHPGSGRGLLLGSFTLHGGGRSTRSSALVRPFAFQTTPVPGPVHPPYAESGELESHTCGAHSLAARPGALAGSLSISSLEAPAGFEPASPALQAGT